MELLQQVGFWHWFILGVVLVILEIFAPGVIFMWLAIAAALTGFVVLIVGDLAWEHQALVFAGLAVASVVAGRVWWARQGTTVTDHPTLNRRGEQYVGRVLALAEPMVNGVGKVKVGDALWKASGPQDLPEGTQVTVTGVDGTVLKVEKTPVAES